LHASSLIIKQEIWKKIPILQDLAAALPVPLPSLFGTPLLALFQFDLWFRPWGVALLLGLREVPPRLLCLGRVE